MEAEYRSAPQEARFAFQFEADGAQLHAQALDQTEINMLRAVADSAIGARPGRRLQRVPGALHAMLAANGTLGRIAHDALAAAARPVRLVAFDKTKSNNWAVGWHQDRTIAVRERREKEGFGPWSVKDGVQHVAPPIGVLQNMATLRIHLDDCGPDNSPLLIAPGSHKIGLVAAADAARAARRLGIVACTARAGDVWVYRTLILHASEPAQIPMRRRVIQIDFSAMELPCGLQWLGLEPEFE